MAKRIFYIGLGIVLVGLLLRLPLLGGSFWLDEAAQALESARPLSQQLDIIPDFQPPLLHLMVHFALYLGKSEWWLRTVGAVIPGLVTLYFTYQIASKIGSLKTGVIAGLMLATSSFHIFYSQELRPYSLSAMFAVLSWWALLEWGSIKNSLAKIDVKNRFFIMFTLSSILGLYSSYLYPFLLLSQICYVLYIYRFKVHNFVFSLMLSGACFLPWLPTFFKQLQAGGMVRTSLPGWEEVVSIPQLKAIPLVLAKFLFGVVDLSISWTFLVVGLTVAVVTLLLAFKLKAKDFSKLIPAFVWLGVPLATSWIISFWIPVVRPKRLLLLLPVWYILLAFLGSGKSKLAKMLVALVLAINLVGTWQYYQQPELQRENWRQAHTEIIAKYPATDSMAVFVYIAPYSPWVWYDNWQYPTLYTHTLHVDQHQDLRNWLEPATNYRYLIVFDYLRDLTDPEDRLIKEIEAYDYQLIDLLEYPNLGFVRVFAKRESVLGQGKI